MSHDKMLKEFILEYSGAPSFDIVLSYLNNNTESFGNNTKSARNI